MGKNGHGAYNAAKRNNWFDECTKHMTLIRKSKENWTKEKCIKDALKYKSKTEWKNKSVSAYRIACKNNWLEECSKHMTTLKKLNGYWTKEKCIEDALKYNSRSEWQNEGRGAYAAAKRNDCFDECTKHMKK